jgi:hypothetical protein
MVINRLQKWPSMRLQDALELNQIQHCNTLRPTRSPADQINVLRRCGTLHSTLGRHSTAVQAYSTNENLISGK